MRSIDGFLPTEEFVIVHKPSTDFGYNPKIVSTQRLLLFSILIEGAIHEYGRCHFSTVEEIISGSIEYKLS